MREYKLFSILSLTFKLSHREAFWAKSRKCRKKGGHEYIFCILCLAFTNCNHFKFAFPETTLIYEPIKDLNTSARISY